MSHPETLYSSRLLGDTPRSHLPQTLGGSTVELMGDTMPPLLRAAVTQLLSAALYQAWNYPVIRDLQREHKRAVSDKTGRFKKKKIASQF